MSKQQVVNELHKPARKNFHRKRTIIKGYDDLWQMDLAEFRNYARENKGHRYILVVIDCFSKYLFTAPVKSKTGKEVTRAFTAILKKSGRTPRNLQSDRGREFYNRDFELLMEKYNINHYSTYSVIKASMAERVIRTLKTALFKQFSMRGKYRWIDVLAQITQDYNNTKHRTIGMKPSKVFPDTKMTAFHHLKTMGKQRYHRGDFVRISKYKSIFAKGYTPTWSTEIFKITDVRVGDPVTYMLEDMNGQSIRGQFYEQELQKTQHPDIYLVEKVLRRSGNKLRVRWLGLDQSHDSWINKDDFV